MQINSNTSFDSDSDLNQENVANNNKWQSSDRLMFGAQKALGNFTQKANEHLINAIMRQADCSGGVMETIGFPKWTNWLKDNLCGWLHLEEYLMGKFIFY